jgi:hypothetical protein
MLDLLYVAMTVGFFVFMLLYIRGCESLGRGADESKDVR